LFERYDRKMLVFHVTSFADLRDGVTWTG
jgi:hypothetical protein